MNSFSHGFIFLLGLCWLLCEVCVGASAGLWAPVWFYLVGLIVMFSVMGCWPMSEKGLDIAGAAFAVLIAVGIVSYGFQAFSEGALVGGIVRVIGALFMAHLAVSGLVGQLRVAEKSAEEH